MAPSSLRILVEKPCRTPRVPAWLLLQPVSGNPTFRYSIFCLYHSFSYMLFLVCYLYLSLQGQCMAASPATPSPALLIWTLASWHVTALLLSPCSSSVGPFSRPSLSPALTPLLRGGRAGVPSIQPKQTGQLVLGGVETAGQTAPWSPMATRPGHCRLPGHMQIHPSRSPLNTYNVPNDGLASGKFTFLFPTLRQVHQSQA